MSALLARRRMTPKRARLANRVDVAVRQGRRASQSLKAPRSSFCRCSIEQERLAAAGEFSCGCLQAHPDRTGILTSFQVFYDRSISDEEPVFFEIDLAGEQLS